MILFKYRTCMSSSNCDVSTLWIGSFSWTSRAVFFLRFFFVLLMNTMYSVHRCTMYIFWCILCYIDQYSVLMCLDCVSTSGESTLSFRLTLRVDRQMWAGFSIFRYFYFLFCYEYEVFYLSMKSVSFWPYSCYQVSRMCFVCQRIVFFLKNERRADSNIWVDLSVFNSSFF